MNERALPIRVKRLITTMQRKRQTLSKSYRKGPNGGAEVIYLLEPSGRRIGAWTAEKAIKLQLLVPAGDGLFGPASSQSWSLQ